MIIFSRPNSVAAKKARISQDGIQAAKIVVDEKWSNLGKLTFWEFVRFIIALQ